MNNKEHISTLNYYNINAQEFIDNTFSTNIQESQDKFLSLLKPKSNILDVGCGSGRDSLYFLNKGFNVTAFDASEELAKIASEKINHPVLVKNIEDINWNNEFDAIWAMASLLHLKKEDLPHAFSKCSQALKQDNNSIFFASFKMGEGEGFDDKGRFFSYYSKDELNTLLLESNLFTNITFNINEDKLGRPGLSWISFFAEKAPSLELKLIKNKIK